MNFRVISLPPFKTVSSGLDKNFDFSENGVLGKFNAYFSQIKPKPADDFMPRDFLYFDEQQGGMVWIYALTDYIDTEEFETFDFDGGLYVTYHYKDGDDEENERLYKDVLAWIEKSELFELDKREHHYPMGHIITPQEVIKAQGFAQMESFVPVRLKTK
ncbi:GyrI-like domain-containing protein [Scatolibacter rhodanostii]|uniref:GyrI-like domain-containing protein n=1 Tax=Scatolibacter rhodanostii TaxID=2014781 RepID=UPI000C081B9D|nr:GyrI-like domain-containing protein [Scatolibacter rhodanostii]